MVTKNAKLMEKKITKPTISKPSNVALRKVDKPRTAMTNLKKDEKSIKDAIASINYNKQYANTKRYNLNNELKANREKQTKVQKVIDSRTKANNKDLSKSLGSVANNKGMKKSDVKGTVKLAEKTLSAAEQNLKKISNTKVRTSAGQSTIGKSRAYELSREDNKRYNDAQKAVSMAKKNLNNLNKTAIKVNNKDLSKSLGSVASNKGMNKANLQGTYNEQKRRAYNHYIESQTDYDGNGGVSTYNMTEYLKAKKAQKQMKSIDKTAKKQGVKLKK